MALMSEQQIRILVVDDSAFMRKALSMMLESDPSIKVVGTARDGAEGVEKVKLLKPDLVTMDIEMPRMDGLAALREIMTTNPVPVMMVSSLTTEGADATMKALEMGAVDFIPKQLSYVSLDIVKIKEELLAKIKDIVRRKNILMARYKVRALGSPKQAATTPTASRPTTPSTRVPTAGGKTAAKKHHVINIISIGSSTGGPLALQTVIANLPRNLPVPILIAQHMPPMFTKSLAERLDALAQLKVKEAEDGEWTQPGSVYIAPGGKHLTVRKVGSRSQLMVSPEPKDTLYHPCVDILMLSVAEAFGGFAMGVILTGMGDNGVVGLKKLKEKGGVVIAQDEASSVVYGMPRAVVEAKLPDAVASLEDIPAEIASYF